MTKVAIFRETWLFSVKHGNNYSWHQPQPWTLHDPWCPLTLNDPWSEVEPEPTHGATAQKLEYLKKLASRKKAKCSGHSPWIFTENKFNVMLSITLYLGKKWSSDMELLPSVTIIWQFQFTILKNTYSNDEITVQPYPYLSCTFRNSEFRNNILLLNLTQQFKSYLAVMINFCLVSCLLFLVLTTCGRLS